MTDNSYKIKLGTKLDTSDLQTQINRAGDAIKPIDIKVDAETKELTKTINEALKSLSKGGQNALTLDTSKLESSLNDVTSTIKEIKTAIGSLDAGSGMKSLVGSINSIGTALDKASNKFDELFRDLKSLTSKDFSINFGINMGGSNPIARNAAYGQKARGETLPQLKQQMNALIKYYNDTYKKNFNEVEVLSQLISGTKLGSGDAFHNLFYGDNSTFSRMTSKSLSTQMQAYKEYIDIFKQASNLRGLDISSVTSQFSKSADQLVQDTVDIQTGAKEMEESFEKLKQIFGSGNNLNVEGLSAQLDSIVVDLGEIKTVLQGLSTGVSLEGLTASFDRLSDTLKELMTNAKTVQDVLNNSFSSGASTGVAKADIIPDSNEVVQSAQQVGKKIGDTIEQSVKKSINLDDVIDQQTLDLMNKYSIVGDRGSKAFNEIRQALVECRNELNTLKNSDIGIDEEVFDTSRAVDKVTDAITNQIRAVNNLGDEYVELANYMTRFNDPAKGNKVRLPDVIKQEQGDDYRSSRGSLGTAFNTERGISFVDFINDLNHELGDTISLTNGEAAAMDELLRKVEIGRKQRDAAGKSEKYLTSTASTEEILEQNGINREEVYGDVMSIAGVVNSAEQQIAQSSTRSANVVAQSEERKQQAYRETAGVIENLKTTLETMRVDKSSIDAIVKDVEELGFTAKNTSVEMKNGKFDITVNGIDDIGRAITEIRRFDSATDKISLVGRKISQPLTESEKFVKQQKKAVSELTNQINQLNRSAIDQNANRPIKDSAHLDTLESKYNEITSAIQRMGSASSNTFDEEASNVKALISEYKSLTKEFRNAENVSSKMKGTDFASGLDIAKNDLEKFKAQARDFPQITATIEELDRAIEGVGDTSSLNKFNDQLRVARSELAKIKSETSATNRNEKVGINVSGLESKIADIQRISPEIDKFETEIDGAKVSVQSLLNDLKQVKTQGDFSVVNSRFKAFADAAKAAGIAVTEVVTKVKSVKDIKLDIELGTYDNQISQMDDKFNRLSSASKELRDSVEQVRRAYAQMERALEGTGDEVADKERLIQAEKEYAAALEKTNNLIRIQARANKADNDRLRLEDDIKVFQSKVDAWLTNNSAAAKEFGATMLDLKAKAEGVDRVTLNHLEKEFKQVDNAAEKAGLKGLSTVDRIKGKFKEYMSYFSVAEVFMWVEQGLREMFNTVKEIDTAMTGLRRVTDLSTTQYNALFNNMINSAKEYGATLNDIINATTDWVRAGFDADTALGLAEVTTMYQHISDLDYDTAAENLLTAYNGFKSELNNLYSGDEVAAVEYIADIFNELDKQNCP